MILPAASSVQACLAVEAPSYDPRLPLVPECHGASINVSFQLIDPDALKFYAPSVPGVEYRQAHPVGD